MLLFKKKDLLVVISKSGETVQFTKPLKDILKYQYRYNYKFKMYENGKVTTADEYIINGETLTVLFGSVTVTYDSTGASYTEGSGGSGGGSGSNDGFTLYGPYYAYVPAELTFTANKTKNVNITDFTDDNGVLVTLPDTAKSVISMMSNLNKNLQVVGFGLDQNIARFDIRNATENSVTSFENEISLIFFSDTEATKQA